MNEAETIDAYIIPTLKAAGWGAESCGIRREHPIPPGRIEGHGKRGKALLAGEEGEHRRDGKDAERLEKFLAQRLS